MSPMTIMRGVCISIAAAALVAAANAQAVNGAGTKTDPGAASSPKPAAKARATKPAAAPKAKPASRRVSKKAVKIPAAANVIVQELRREFELGKLRSKSDYFATSPNAEMTADVIVTMLSRRLGTSNSMDAYIKWQLLSGLPDTIPEQIVEEALSAYRDAPTLQPRPGMSPEDKKALDRELKRSTSPADVKAMLIDESRRVDVLNEPVVSYREELFSKLPDNFGVLQEALLDVYRRAEAGAAPARFAGKVAARISKWSQQADQAEVGDMAAIVDELLAAKRPDYYNDVRATNDGYVWASTSANLQENKQLDDLTLVLARKQTRNDPQR